jgi:hypothetical protein
MLESQLDLGKISVGDVWVVLEEEVLFHFAYLYFGIPCAMQVSCRFKIYERGTIY